MKDIFKGAKQIATANYLIDTCFLVWVFQKQLQKDFAKFLKTHDCAITSFNVEEFEYINIPTKVLQEAKHFFKHNELPILHIPAHAGDREAEKQYVEQNLAKFEHDLSDAVLLQAAILVHANVLTRDKHDIFNAHIENYLHDKGVSVYNTLHFE